jgi:D-alanyl-D-alanine carboxypeptidase
VPPHVTVAKRLFPIGGAAAWLFLPCLAWALNVQQLEPVELKTLEAILATLEPVIAAKKQDGTANLLTWQELYAPLTPEQQAFLDAFQALNAKALGATSHYFGEAGDADLVPVGPQQLLSNPDNIQLHPQYLPREVLAAYQRMMDAMEADLGRRLLVESGYRSPAYQLYLFLYYMKNHDFSIRETNRFVALPGHSEHGYPPRQAIDFINEHGINGEYNPEAFEALPEYAWLQQHAHEYGFVLSYPRDNPYNTAFEPWHWHYEKP